jgi:hypothetical protein
MYDNHEDSMWGIGDEEWRNKASCESDIAIGHILASEYDVMLAVEKLSQHHGRGPTEQEIEHYILMIYG